MKTGELFSHRARPEWGVGLLLREAGKNRTLLFEDGQLRRLARSADTMLEPVTAQQLAANSPLASLLAQQAEALRDVPESLHDFLRGSWLAQLATNADGDDRRVQMLGRQSRQVIERELQKKCILTGDPRYRRVMDFERRLSLKSLLNKK